jgi:hypothetical protein
MISPWDSTLSNEISGEISGGISGIIGRWYCRIQWILSNDVAQREKGFFKATQPRLQ